MDVTQRLNAPGAEFEGGGVSSALARRVLTATLVVASVVFALWSGERWILF